MNLSSQELVTRSSMLCNLKRNDPDRGDIEIMLIVIPILYRNIICAVILVNYSSKFDFFLDEAILMSDIKIALPCG